MSLQEITWLFIAQFNLRAYSTYLLIYLLNITEQPSPWYYWVPKYFFMVHTVVQNCWYRPTLQLAMYTASVFICVNEMCNTDWCQSVQTVRYWCQNFSRTLCHHNLVPKCLGSKVSGHLARVVQIIAFLSACCSVGGNQRTVLKIAS